VLKWAFVLIALLPVSLYNRSVLQMNVAATAAQHVELGKIAVGTGDRSGRSRP